MEKVDVNGPGTHPVYKFLKESSEAADIKWNPACTSCNPEFTVMLCSPAAAQEFWELLPGEPFRCRQAPGWWEELTNVLQRCGSKRAVGYGVTSPSVLLQCTAVDNARWSRHQLIHMSVEFFVAQLRHRASRSCGQ